MQIDLLDPTQLSTDQFAAWRKLQRADTNCDSPFLSAGFTRAVASVRSDVAVASLRQDGEYVGFFPFQRVGRKTGRPVGWKLNDFQGAVVSGRTDIDAAELLLGANLTAWHFDHLVPGQTLCRAGYSLQAESPFINLAGGFEEYLQLKAGSKSRLKTVLRKSRKLVREFGPLRLEFDCRDSTVFDRMLEWKCRQLQGMRAFNVFRFDWARQLLDLLRSSHDEDCRGTLAAMWAGDQLVAAHLGLRNESVLHWWITSYNRKFKRYSPGNILLLELLKAAAERGMTRVDLGKGHESYKKSFQTGTVVVSEGAAACSSHRRAALQAAYSVRNTIRSSWLSMPARWMKRSYRELAGKFSSSTQSALTSSASKPA